MSFWYSVVVGFVGCDCGLKSETRKWTRREKIRIARVNQTALVRGEGQWTIN